MAKPANQQNIFERLAELGGIQVQAVKGDVIEQFTGNPPKAPNLPNSEHFSQKNYTPLDTAKMEENFKQKHDNPELAAAREALKTEQVQPEDQAAFSRFRREEKTFYAQQKQEAQRAKRQAEEEEALKKKKEEEERLADSQNPQLPQSPKKGPGNRKANIENKMGKGS